MRPDFQSVWRNISADPSRVFLCSQKVLVRYGELVKLISGFCAAFDRDRLAAGDRVVIVSENEPVACAAFLAALLDGMVPVMLSPDSRADRILSICNSVEPGVMIVDEPAEATLAQGEPLGFRVISVPMSSNLEMPRRSFTSVLRGFMRTPKRSTETGNLGLPENGREPHLPAVDDALAYILFTSGTTKAPSGVKIARSSVMAQLETLNRLFKYNAQSRIFNATPLAHTDGMVQGLLLAAANGAALLRPGKFSLTELEEWLERLGRFEATHFITNPTTLALIDRFAAHDDYFDDPNFFGVLSSASILRASLWEKFESRFGCSLYNMYGMTETVANATYAGRHPEMGPVGTIGIPVDCEIRLVEPGLASVENGPQEEGEIQVRGENVFLGYWKDPVRTAETFTRDNWMRTGDLARRGKDGGLEIIGRIRTMINMGGLSILPEEIDEVLALHPAVVDVATIGIHDPQFEEAVVSAVVLERPASEAELTEFCRRHLEMLKVPKRILQIEKVPRGDAGKPRTGELRDLLVSLLEGGEAAKVPTQNGDTVSEEAIYELAARVFRLPAVELSADSSPATVPGWDSFTQLSLVIEAEMRFDISIPAARVASIRSLGDLHQTVNALR